MHAKPDFPVHPLRISVSPTDLHVCFVGGWWNLVVGLKDGGPCWLHSFLGPAAQSQWPVALSPQGKIHTTHNRICAYTHKPPWPFPHVARFPRDTYSTFTHSGEIHPQTQTHLCNSHAYTLPSRRFYLRQALYIPCSLGYISQIRRQNMALDTPSTTFSLSLCLLSEIPSVLPWRVTQRGGGEGGRGPTDEFRK